MKHARRMKELGQAAKLAANLKDGFRLHSRLLESPLGPELPVAIDATRAARETQAEEVDGARQVSQAHANHTPTDSETD